MGYFVDIRRNEDGVIHRYYMADLSWDAGSDYWWQEGNMSCDCNRELYFARAIGEEAESVQCGDEAFSVRCVAEDGTALYEDESWDEA